MSYHHEQLSKQLSESNSIRTQVVSFSDFRRNAHSGGRHWHLPWLALGRDSSNPYESVSMALDQFRIYELPGIHLKYYAGISPELTSRTRNTLGLRRATTICHPVDLTDQLGGIERPSECVRFESHSGNDTLSGSYRSQPAARCLSVDRLSSRRKCIHYSFNLHKPVR